MRTFISLNFIILAFTFVLLFPAKSIYSQREGYTDPSSDRFKTVNKKDTLTNKVSDFYYQMDPSGSNTWDGSHWDVSGFPVKVYVQSSSSKYYKSLFKDYVSYAFRVWQKADSRIKYTFTNNSKDADIEISFVENLAKIYNKNYMGLTQYYTNSYKQIISPKIQITLLRFDDIVVPDGEVKATIIHELGHAFGLPHTTNEEDIMFPYMIPDHSAKQSYDELSRGDKKAIREIIDAGTKKNYLYK
jgi:predicted Zn-dependent protease